MKPASMRHVWLGSSSTWLMCCWQIRTKNPCPNTHLGTLGKMRRNMAFFTTLYVTQPSCWERRNKASWHDLQIGWRPSLLGLGWRSLLLNKVPFAIRLEAMAFRLEAIATSIQRKAVPHTLPDCIGWVPAWRPQKPVSSVTKARSPVTCVFVRLFKFKHL